MNRQIEVEAWASKSSDDEVQRHLDIWLDQGCCYYGEGAYAYDILLSKYDWDTSPQGRKLNNLPYGDE